MEDMGKLLKELERLIKLLEENRKQEHAIKMKIVDIKRKLYGRI